MKNKAYILFAIIMLIGLIILPQQCLEAAKGGLDLCQKVIIPSLFPFFVCSKLLIQLGFVAILGRKCSCIMRPLFHVPGIGAFSFCLGILSGYPVGAKAVTELYEKRLCTKTEAERLLAFCNNSGPLFIIGAVGTGLYHSPQIGFMLYAAHVLSAVTIGFLFRFYKRKEMPYEKKDSMSSIIITSNLGDLLGKAIKDSILSVAVVCGFILFFSVLIAIMQAFHIITLLSGLFAFFGIAPDASQGFSYGILELTNGVKQLAPSYAFLPLTGFLLAWSGISVVLQVAGIISRYHLSLKAFIFAKLFQGTAAFFYTYLFTFLIATPTFIEITKNPPNESLESAWFYLFSSVFIVVIIFALTLSIGYRFKTHKA